MHGRLGRSDSGIDALVLANSILGAGPLTAGLSQRCLCGYVLSARGRQSGYCRAFARPRLIERGESRCPLGPGFLHVVAVTNCCDSSGSTRFK